MVANTDGAGSLFWLDKLLADPIVTTFCFLIFKARV